MSDEHDDPQTFVCTKDNPWTPEKAKGFSLHVHPDAGWVGTWEGSDGEARDRYLCPNCGWEGV